MFRLNSVVLLALLFSGRAGKVNPWERGALARPQMALEPEALDFALRKHTYSFKEGASGGYGVGGGGGGCGRN